MSSGPAFRRIALGLEGAVESAHMGHPDFRVNNRIFASLRDRDTLGMVVLTPDQQEEFLHGSSPGFEAESGAWGRAGCTRVRLALVDDEALGEAMTLAWRNALAKPPGRGAKPAPSKPRRTFTRMVAAYPPDVQALARGARALILDVLSGVEEHVHATGPYVTYGFGSDVRDTISYITVSKTGVKLGVARGTSLSDPRKLLRGTGKSARHVVLRTSSDLRTPCLRQLVRAALAAWKKDRA
jgi:hypothetical protein